MGHILGIAFSWIVLGALALVFKERPDTSLKTALKITALGPISFFTK